MIEIIACKIQELLGSEYAVYLNNTVDVLKKEEQHTNICVLVAQSGDIEPLKGVSGLNANCTLVMSYQASASGYTADEDKIQWATTQAEQVLQTLAASANGYIEADGISWNYIFNFSVPKPMNATTLNGEIWYNVALPINVIVSSDLLFGNSGVIKIGNPLFMLVNKANVVGQTLTVSLTGMNTTDNVYVFFKGYTDYALNVGNPFANNGFAQDNCVGLWRVNEGLTEATITFTLPSGVTGTETATVSTDNGDIPNVGYDFEIVPAIEGITRWDYMFTNNLEYVAKVSVLSENRAKAVQVFSNLQMPIEMLLMASSEHYQLLTNLRNNPTTRLFAEFTLPITATEQFREVFVVLPKDVHISGSLGQFIGLDITLSEALNE